MSTDVTTDYDGTEYPDAEGRVERGLRGVPDGFQRLWTPHRIAYIEQGRPAAGATSARSARRRR